MIPVIIMIEVKKSPYVMYINNTPFRKTRNGIESRLFGCLDKYIHIMSYLDNTRIDKKSYWKVYDVEEILKLFIARLDYYTMHL